MNEIAKGYWDLATKWLSHADDANDVNTTICYTGMAECALKAAQFAVDNPSLVLGQDSVPMPPGQIVGTVPQAPHAPAPGPTQGPRLWGPPTS